MYWKEASQWRTDLTINNIIVYVYDWANDSLKRKAPVLYYMTIIGSRKAAEEMTSSQ